MKCYYSSNEDAVGICRSCGKGLSRDYAVDLGRGLACKGRCEEDVRAIIHLIGSNAKIAARPHEHAKKNSFILYGTAAFMFAMGMFILGFGVFRDYELFETGLGTIFMVYGAFLFICAHRAAQTCSGKTHSQPPVLAPDEQKAHAP
jgi:hypothetical protein